MVLCLAFPKIHHRLIGPEKGNRPYRESWSGRNGTVLNWIVTDSWREDFSLFRTLINILRSGESSSALPTPPVLNSLSTIGFSWSFLTSVISSLCMVVPTFCFVFYCDFFKILDVSQRIFTNYHRFYKDFDLLLTNFHAKLKRTIPIQNWSL